MTKIAESVSFISKISVGAILVLLNSCNLTQNQMIDSMTGLWIIDIDSSDIMRNDTFEFVSNTIFIDKDEVNVPSVFNPLVLPSDLCEDEKHELIVKYNEKMEKIGTGTYCFPNGNIDSVLFDVEDNPLSGRYKIDIYHDKSSFLMILRNDSTYLYCTSNKVLY